MSKHAEPVLWGCCACSWALAHTPCLRSQGSKPTAGIHRHCHPPPSLLLHFSHDHQFRLLVFFWTSVSNGVLSCWATENRLQDNLITFLAQISFNICLIHDCFLFYRFYFWTVWFESGRPKWKCTVSTCNYYNIDTIGWKMKLEQWWHHCFLQNCFTADLTTITTIS